MWFLQIAQLSTTISHAHKATAFHFLTSNRFLPSAPPSPPDLADLAAGAFDFAGAEGPASGISTSAIVSVNVCGVDCQIKNKEHSWRWLKRNGCERGEALLIKSCYDAVRPCVRVKKSVKDRWARDRN